MKRNWKRILSLLLCVAMVLTMDTSAFAGEYVSENAAEAAETQAVSAEGIADETSEAETVSASAENTEAAASEDTADSEYSVSKEAAENAAGQTYAGASLSNDVPYTLSVKNACAGMTYAISEVSTNMTIGGFTVSAVSASVSGQTISFGSLYAGDSYYLYEWATATETESAGTPQLVSDSVMVRAGSLAGMFGVEAGAKTVYFYVNNISVNGYVKFAVVSGNAATISDNYFDISYMCMKDAQSDGYIANEVEYYDLENGQQLRISENSTYKVYAAFFNFGYISRISDIEWVATVSTCAVTQPKATVSVNDFAYMGKGKKIYSKFSISEENVSPGYVKVYAISRNDSRLNDFLEFPMIGPDIELYDDWPAGDYTALAYFYEGNTLDIHGNSCIASPSVNFTIQQAPEYFQPFIRTNHLIVPRGVKLGDMLQQFGYTHENANGEDVTVSDGSTIEYVTDDGKVLSSDTVFDTPGTVSVFVSGNIILNDKNYRFVADKTKAVTFTVIEFDQSGIKITATGKNTVWKNDIQGNIADYVSVKTGAEDITNDCTYTYSASEDGPFGDWQDFDAGTVYVSADCVGYHTKDPAAVTIEKLPIHISAADEVHSLKNMPIETTYSGKVVVRKDDLHGIAVSNNVALSDISMSSDAAIDTSKVDNKEAKFYSTKFLNFSLRPGSVWEKNCILQYTYVNYWVDESYTLTFRSAKDGSTIAPSQTVSVNTNYVTVSLNTAEPVEYWYYYDKESDSLTYFNIIKYDTAKGCYVINWALYDMDLYAAFASQTVSDEYVSIIPIRPAVYDGSAHIIDGSRANSHQHGDLELVIKEGGVTLNRGTDYKVSYRNNVNAATADSAKPPTIIVKGIGAHKGLYRELHFTILPADLKYASIKSKADIVKYTSKGLVTAPLVQLFSRTLRYGAGKDYTISYYSNYGKEVDAKSFDRKSGVNYYMIAATAVSGSNYTGSTGLSDTFEAIPAVSVKMKVKMKNTKVACSSEKTSVSAADFVIKQVRAGGMTLSADDYYIGSFYKSDKKTEAGKTLTQAGNYYMVLFPTNDGYSKGVYEPAYVKVQFTGTKLKKSMFSLAYAKLDYTRENQTNVLKIKDSSLSKDDINIYYSQPDGIDCHFTGSGTDIGQGVTNAAAGKYTVSIYGSGQYYCDSPVTFTYTVGAAKANGSDFAVTVNSGNAAVYDAGGYDSTKVPVEVFWKWQKLTAGTDYTLTYAKPSGIGAAAGSVTVTFTGSYKGKLTQKFAVVTDADGKTADRFVKTAAVTLSENKTGFDYTGAAIKPGVASVKVAGKEAAPEYYTVSYGDDCVSVGTHVIYITFRPGADGSYPYGGMVVKKFSIVRKYK